MTAPVEITSAFEAGYGVELEGDATAIRADLDIVHNHLWELPVEASFSWPGFEGTGTFPTRRSLWIVNRPDGSLVTSPHEIRETDGDHTAGERGLVALEDSEFRAAVTCLYNRGAVCLRATARASGMPETFIDTCSVRSRLIDYDGSEETGIGPHFDGNALSAVLTNAPGLTEIRRDGTLYEVDPASISVMAGTSLYRASSRREKPFLPALHAVRRVAKTSMAMFLNFPDKTSIPPTLFGTSFYHDIAEMKAQDGPHGAIKDLWRLIADAHGITVEELAAGEFALRPEDQ